MVVKKSCVAAYPVGWPDGRGISGRMRVEWVAGSPWNRWSDAHGMGGQMTVESAVTSQMPVDNWHELIGDPTLADAILDRLVHNAYRINLKGESMRKRTQKLTTPGTSD